VSRKQWKAGEQKMMQAAGRFHGMRAAVLLILLVLLGWGAYEINGNLQAAALVNSLRTAKEDAVLGVIEQVGPYRRWAGGRLRSLLASEPRTLEEQRAALHARMALLPVEPRLAEDLKETLLDPATAYSYVGVLRDALQPYRGRFTSQLWGGLRAADERAERRFRAGLALAGYEPASDVATFDLALDIHHPAEIALFQAAMSPFVARGFQQGGGVPLVFFVQAVVTCQEIFDARKCSISTAFLQISLGHGDQSRSVTWAEVERSAAEHQQQAGGQSDDQDGDGASPPVAARQDKALPHVARHLRGRVGKGLVGTGTWCKQISGKRMEVTGMGRGRIRVLERRGHVFSGHVFSGHVRFQDA
jgi:hypothetical protein